MVSAARIELALSVPKTDVLPLDKADIFPTRMSGTFYSSIFSIDALVSNVER